MKKIRTILHTINTIKKLEVKGLRSYSCVLFILNILKSLNEVYSIIMLKIIFDILYTKKIVLISITICILLIISFIFEYVINKMHSIILPRIEQSLKASIDLKILQNINTIGLSDYDNSKTYDKIYSCIALGSNSVMEYIQNCANMISSILSIIGVLLIIGYYDWLFVFFTILFVFFDVFLNFKKSKVEYDKSIEMIPPDRTISYIQRLFCMKQYIGDMRIYDWFKVVKDKYISASNTKQSCIEKYGKKSLRIITELNFLQLSLQLVIIIYLAVKYILNSIKLSDFLVIYNGIMEISGNFMSLVDYIPNLYKCSLYIDLVNNIFEQKISTKETSRIERVDNLKIKNLFFRYKDDTIFKNFNYTFKKGESYVIYGKNGSGKSTLVNLLTGLYDSQNSITINDNIINNHSNILGCVSVVFQHFQFNAFSIVENLVMHSSVTLEEEKSIYKVLDCVGLKEKIENFPNKLNTYITNELDQHGANFSGGELQRLAIARMLLNMKEIIIMDEPTSALDNDVKREILDIVLENTRNTIFIYITHDPNDMQKFDHIIYLGDEYEKSL